MKIQGKELKQYLAEITKSCEPILWGQRWGEDYTPKLCKEIQGDGLQIVRFSNIDQRPRYWLLRIDSKTDVKAEDFDFEDLEKVIEEEFGSYYYSEEDYSEEDCYPKISLESSPHWGLKANFKTGEHRFDCSISPKN